MLGTFKCISFLPIQRQKNIGNIRFIVILARYKDANRKYSECVDINTFIAKRCKIRIPLSLLFYSLASVFNPMIEILDMIFVTHFLSGLSNTFTQFYFILISTSFSVKNRKTLTRVEKSWVYFHRSFIVG